MPAPENQAALERFLGMTSYLNKFIKDYGEKTATLRELHHNDVVLFFDRNPSVSIRQTETPRRDRIWVWCHDSAVDLSRQDDWASARNSGRCNHAEFDEVHQGRLAWAWAKCSTWRKKQQPLFPFRDELVVENDVFLKWQKAVERESLQSTYVAILHKGHQTACQRCGLLAKDAGRHRECCLSVFFMHECLFYKVQHSGTHYRMVSVNQHQYLLSSKP